MPKYVKPHNNFVWVPYACHYKPRHYRQFICSTRKFGLKICGLWSKVGYDDGCTVYIFLPKNLTNFDPLRKNSIIELTLKCRRFHPMYRVDCQWCWFSLEISMNSSSLFIVLCIDSQLFYIQLVSKLHFGTRILLFGPFGQLRTVRKKPNLSIS